jgi:hypothetical protein
MILPYKWVYVTTVWCILMLWEEEPPYGGSLRLYWISSPGHTRRSGPPGGGRGVRQGGNNFSSYKHTMFWTNGKVFWLWLYLWYILLSRLNWFWCNRSTLIYSAFVKYFSKNGNSVRQCVIYLWTSRKPMIQLGGRSWYNILTELVIPNKLVRLIKCI